MIAILLTELATALSPVMFAADSEGGATWLLALGPAGGGAVYYGMWHYYRNADKSHSYERETRIGAQPVSGNDAKVREITGTKESSIDGDNRSNHRQRVQRVDE